MSEYLENISEGTESIRGIAACLNYLSESFYATGNKRISEDLSKMANDLLVADKQINNAVSVEINDRLMEGRKFDSKIIKAVIGVKENQ